jgi:methionyl-tRNA formyltransferase
MAGDAETGVSIMRMELGLDSGPVLLSGATPIGPTDTSGDLHVSLAGIGARLIIDALCDPGALVAEPQSEDVVTYAVKISKSEARIDWTRRAADVDRQIRGLSPFPGAWMDVDGERIKLLRSKIADGMGASGVHLGGFRIACGEGAVQIIEAQRQGKRPMEAKELLRGLDLPQRLN